MVKKSVTTCESGVVMSYADRMALLNSAGRLAHDIYSPIATMEMGLHQIEQYHHSTNKQDFILVRMAIQRLREITNSFLNQYRNHSDERHVYVKPVLEEVIRLKCYEWLDKDCELILSFESICDSDSFNVDVDEVKRLLSNLLNNAIESCEQHAEVRVRVTKVDETIEIYISDNGSGIPAEKIQDFLNGESSKHVGVGLGLSNAKHYMRSINGCLSVTSTLGLGTTVTLKFK